MEDPVTHVRATVNSPSDNPSRAEGSNFAVYSDGVAPTTTASVSPAPNANGWNNSAVTVTLNATDLASGILDTPPGWVDQLEYTTAGVPHVVPGHAVSFGVSAPGVTTVTYFATDAAGNEEPPKTLDVRVDPEAPAIAGLPGGSCVLWPPSNKKQRVAVVSARDPVSGVAAFQVTATSNEPIDPNDPDAIVTADGLGGFVVDLRAARLGAGSGRVYTLTATATDLAGNTRTSTASCIVPHDQGKQ
jgi:hypothetical protein